jgi:hypothetical protein
MKKLKSYIIAAVVPFVILMMGLGILYGGVSSKQYHEGGLAASKDSTFGADPSTFTPARSKDKSESLAESESHRLTVPMERYKPYKEGEGESKTR